MKKTFLSGLLVLAMLMSAQFTFANGSGDKDPAMQGDDYPIEISIFNISTEGVPPEDNKMYKWMKDTFNVTFKWDILVGDRDQKIGVMNASGDYPDIVYSEGSKFVDAGALIPLEDLIKEYAPSVYQHYEYLWEKMKYPGTDHIYTLPNWGVIDNRYTGSWYSASALWVQKEVLKDAGYPEVVTMDEYFDLLANYKAKYPTIEGLPTVGFTILTYDWHKFCLINPPLFLAGYPNNGDGIVDPKTMEFQCVWDMDISKQWFKKLNEMNQIGLVDRNSFVDNYDQYLAKLSSGRVLGMHDQHWQFQNAQDVLMSSNMGNRTFAPLPIVFDESIKPWYRDQPVPNLNQGYGISVDAKDPIRIVRFWEAQIQEEAQRIMQWGFEGEDYTLNADGYPVRTPEQRTEQDDPIWKLHNKALLWYGNAPKLEGAFSDGLATDIGNTPVEIMANVKPWDKELFDAYGVTNYPDLMDPNPPRNPPAYPAWQISLEDGSDPQIAKTRMEDAYLKWLPRVILADPADFEELWAEYVKALDEAGIETYEAFMTEKLIERATEWGEM